MRKIRKRLLVGCFEPPGYGGAATVAYAMFEWLLNLDFDVYFVPLLGYGRKNWYEKRFGPEFCNPNKRNNVFACHLEGPEFQNRPELSALIESLKPDAIVSVGFVASYAFKKGYPSVPLVQIASGCAQVKEYLKRGWTNNSLEMLSWLYSGRHPRIIHDKEGEAIELSDVVVANSIMTRTFLEKFYPESRDRLYPDWLSLAPWIWNPARQFSHYAKAWPDRGIDLLLIASNWDRIEKNFQAIEQIADALPEYNIHVVGESPKRVDGVTHHNLVGSREQVFGLMGNSRTIVCPSIFDSAPGILFEGAALGCNLVGTQNCGNWQLCHPDLVASSVDYKDLVPTIRTSLKGPLANNMHIFDISGQERIMLDIICGLAMEPRYQQLNAIA